MDPNCLFCRIVAGEIPARLLFEDDELIAFADIAPQAPVHLLIVPKRPSSAPVRDRRRRRRRCSAG